MAIDQARLESLLAKPGAEKQVVKLFHGASIEDRKAAAPCVRSQHAREWKAYHDRQKAGDWSEGLLPLTTRALLACGSLSDVKSPPHYLVDDETTYRILTDRRPEWINSWVQLRARQGKQWNVVRRLVADGVCERPVHDNYVRDMIDSNPPASVFLDDRDLLEAEFWRIFEVPDSMQLETSFGRLDDQWVEVAVVLAKKQAIDRQRLFASCFSALNMGFNSARVKVFFNIHDQLKPTLQEREAMFATYCGLLEHKFSTVVQFAYDRLETLHNERAQDTAQLAGALTAALRQPTKKMGRAVANWMRKLIKQDPKATAAVCQAAASGLSHPNKEVQAEFWKLILQSAPVGDAQLTDEVAAHAAGAAVSLRKEIKLWLKEPSAEAEEAGEVSSGVKLAPLLRKAKQVEKRLAELLGLPELLAAHRAGEARVPGCSFDGTELARLPNATPLRPIGSLEELVETIARVLEDGMLLDDGERVYEALARFPVRDDAAKRKQADPVVKRAWKLLPGSYGYSFVGAGVHRELRPLVIAWADDPEEICKLAVKVQDEEDRRKGFSNFVELCETYTHIERAGFPGFLGLRAKQICERLYTGQPYQLLGAPTHSGGWIDPMALVERAQRLAKSDIEPILYDQILALLRLAPDRRRSALKKVARAEGEFGAALKYALGGPPPRSMKTAGLWVAAARARAPWEDDARVEKRFPNLGVDAGRVAIYEARGDGDEEEGELGWYDDASPKPKPHVSYEARQDVDYSLPTVVAHEHDLHGDLTFALDTKPLEQNITDRAATVWPIARESYFRIDAFDDCAVHLAPLFDPCTPLREMSTAALAMSLGAGFAQQRIQAIDVAIVVIEDGRFCSETFGRVMSLFVKRANRYAKSLPEVAAVSPLHGFQIAQSLVEMLWNEPEDLPNSFAGLLEVLLELIDELGMVVEEPGARAYLESFSGSSKVAKAAKKILEFQPDHALNMAEIHGLALQGRLNTKRELAPT